MTKFPVEGGCHCGAVRYTLLAPALSIQHCHCSRCRKVFGHLAAQGGGVVRQSQIKITGESNLTTYRSSPSFVGSKPEWERLVDDLPKYETTNEIIAGVQRAGS